MKQIFAACLLIALAGCGRQNVARVVPSKQEAPASENAPAKTQRAQYRRISAREAKAMLDANSGAILLDVRTEAEFRAQRIPGSILLPVNEVEAKAAAMLPDKNALILVYCRSGNRSRAAATKLISLGYTNVYDFGGIIEWPYATEKN